MWVTLDLATCDVVFISYDEPEADQNYGTVCNARPDAHRVHAVKGFDAAHRAAGGKAQTEHVITIDGDNRLCDPAFLTSARQFTPQQLTCVISYAARVTHNGLVYGNGGLKIWPRHMLLTLRSHEQNRQSVPGIDFAWQVPYAMADGCPTETHVTATSESAFRAGYREGVRLTMHRGYTARAAYPDLEPEKALRRHLPEIVIRRLQAWCFRAPDTVEGRCAMLGARLGCCDVMLRHADPSGISDFDAMRKKWSDLAGNDGPDPDPLKTLLCQSEQEIAALGIVAPTFEEARTPRLGILLPAQ